MSTLSANDKRVLEKLLQMDGGYVLNFSNRTFEEFFHTTFSINIYDDKYEGWSGSKASRLRTFWDQEDNHTVKILIHELLKYIGNEILLENLKLKDFPDKLVIKAGEIADNLVDDSDKSIENDEDVEFLKQEFSNTKEKIKTLNPDISDIINQRLKEAKTCLENNCPLGAIFLIASTLEGILLEEAFKNFNVIMNSTLVPCDKEGNKIPIDKWSLNNLLIVCRDIGILSENSSYYGGKLRGVRNFIHPREQLRQRFDPNLYLAKISLQVLNSCLYDIDEFERVNKGK